MASSDGEARVVAAPPPEHDHVHDDEPLSRLEDHPIWQRDNVKLHSVGIDIGSSGTQVVFSRLHLQRRSSELASRYVVVEREPLFRSPVRFTPYADEERIDAAELGGLIDEAYAAARMSPTDVDTGVVILTGEALRRRNAERIATIVAERGGDLVTASAGHNMEATLAAFGSGAARASARDSSRLLNVDMGGGTTKLALIDRGRVIHTAAIDIGGRLLVVEDGRVVRLDPAGRRYAAAVGLDLAIGAELGDEGCELIAAAMADALVHVLVRSRSDHPSGARFLTDAFTPSGPVDGVVFSGGVAEYVYDRESRDLGDLGRPLGRAVRRHMMRGSLPWPLAPPGECIRATALGASEYSVQLSGNTVHISDHARLLPRRNLQVVRPVYELGEDIDAASVAGAIRTHLRAFDLDDARTDVALSLGWKGDPAYERLVAFAEGVVAAMAPRIAARRPLYLLLDGDVAMSLGTILTSEFELGTEVVVVDGLLLNDFDYVDIGRLRHPSKTVPVTIKSLVFDAHPPDVPEPRST